MGVLLGAILIWLLHCLVIQVGYLAKNRSPFSTNVWEHEQTQQLSIQNLFFMSYRPPLPLCYACICLFAKVMAINRFGNMKRHGNSKYSVHFASPARRNFHFAVLAFATSVMGKSMLIIATSTEQ